MRLFFILNMYALMLLNIGRCQADDSYFMYSVDGKVLSSHYELSEAIRAGSLPRVKEAAKFLDIQGLVGFDQFLLKEGNPEIVRYFRDTARLRISDLQIAATTNDVTTAAKLLSLMQKTPSTSLGSEHPLSPLRLAIYKGHVEVLKLMLERGVSISDDPGMLYLYYGRDQTTLLKQAIAKGNPKIVKLLLEAGASFEQPATTFVSTVPSVSILDMYAKAKINTSTKTPDERSRMLKALVKAGKVKEVIDKQANKYCPLVKAIWAGRESVVAVLLDAGANPNILIGGENRPLHVAVNSGHVGIVKLLIKAGANVNAPDAKGRTPLSLAYYSRGDIADLLRKAGAVEPGSKKQKPNFRKPAEKEKPEPIPIRFNQNDILTYTTPELNYPFCVK